jgi:hypothetical protein
MGLLNEKQLDDIMSNVHVCDEDWFEELLRMWNDRQTTYQIEIGGSSMLKGDSVHESDSVNAPAHYQGDKMQCIDAMEAMLTQDEFRGYLRGNVFKYQWRFREKGGVEDLRKARWYLDRLIKLENF